MNDAACMETMCRKNDATAVNLRRLRAPDAERRIFVLDTNVLVHDPHSIFKFSDSHVVIPFAVIEELDRLKKGHGEIAASARLSLRIIDALRERGSLSAGIPVGQGGMMSVSASLSESCELFSDGSVEDNRIIRSALSIAEKDLRDDRGDPVAVKIVSKDMAVRIKAESFGLAAEDYRDDKTSIYEMYGRVLCENESLNGIRSARYVHSGDTVQRINDKMSLKPVKRGKEIMGISPKNIEQECAIDALIDPDIDIVALTGRAGTGKTFLALAAGLHQTAKMTRKSSLYDQVMVSRPVIPLGNDLGYLPGDVEEKLRPWMQPIFDNLEAIIGNCRDAVKDRIDLSNMKSYQYLIDAGLLQVEPLTYIRGRSLPRRYFIIDEAQNLRPIDIKTIVTRCGEGTKIVLTGDLDQIDTPYLDKKSNGLAFLISRFINERNFCFLNLRQSVRSRLAERGALLL